jgi:D-3-phosphoglycerate dehydrogenase
MYKINCLNPIANVGLDLFTDKYERVDRFEEANAVLVRSASIHDLELPPSLEAIARAGAGVNNIPLDKCAEQGIVVFNTPGANANGVKEMVIAALIIAARNIVGGVNWVNSCGKDPEVAKLVEKNKSKFAGTEIKGKKLGVIGLGAIGVLVANAANKLEMEVYGYDPFISVEHAWKLSKFIKPTKTLEEIYRECDFITVHVPLTDSTKGMFNKDTFAMMKEGVKILNFSRDSLVVDEDIIEALESGKVGRYVTDFPNPAVCGLLYIESKGEIRLASIPILLRLPLFSIIPTCSITPPISPSIYMDITNIPLLNVLKRVLPYMHNESIISGSSMKKKSPPTRFDTPRLFMKETLTARGISVIAR